jgi:hypothetical protein
VDKEGGGVKQFCSIQGLHCCRCPGSFLPPTSKPKPHRSHAHSQLDHLQLTSNQAPCRHSRVSFCAVFTPRCPWLDRPVLTPTNRSAPPAGRTVVSKKQAAPVARLSAGQCVGNEPFVLCCAALCAALCLTQRAPSIPEPPPLPPHTGANGVARAVVVPRVSRFDAPASPHEAPSPLFAEGAARGHLPPAAPAKMPPDPPLTSPDPEARPTHNQHTHDPHRPRAAWPPAWSARS